MNKGFIKVSVEVWQTRRLRRLVKTIVNILHINLDPITGSYIVVGESKYFTAKRKEGEPLPQYDIVFFDTLKKWLWFKYHKINFKVEQIA